MSHPSDEGMANTFVSRQTDIKVQWTTAHQASMLRSGSTGEVAVCTQTLNEGATQTQTIRPPGPLCSVRFGKGLAAAVDAAFYVERERRS